MRRHAVSTMYNNFICMYIIYFLTKISCERTCKENKKFMHRVISHYNKLRMAEDISMNGKDKLEKFSKKIQEAENMT